MSSDTLNIYHNVEDKFQKLSFSSYINDTQDMKDTLDNFFRANYIEECTKKQKLEPVWSIDFIDRYNISFLGTKMVQNTSKKSVNTNPKPKDQSKETKLRLIAQVKEDKRELSAKNKELRKLEQERMDVAKKLYQQLRDARHRFNTAFEKRKCSVKRLSNGKRTIIQTYHGNWHGITTYMKGHTRILCKEFLKQFQSSKYYCNVVDEYASTKTCSQCFDILRKQVLRRNGKIVRISGALECFNRKYHLTTINRDLNGAKNIASIGFS
ncbi:hypothetical protein K501DRAFT_280446 [Backusella circina FSU 941]|nr:hypothetical protein K501DRAFT_280446 [Backusella circina FSU 941]